MDILLEILFGLFVELPLEAAAESPKIRPWVKTAFFTAFWLVIEAVLLWACWNSLRDGGGWYGIAFAVAGTVIWSWAGAVILRDKRKN